MEIRNSRRARFEFRPAATALSAVTTASVTSAFCVTHDAAAAASARAAQQRGGISSPRDRLDRRVPQGR